jgi:DNA polymerase III delta prime subunit
MELRITKDLASYIGESELKKVDVDYESRGYKEYFTVNLANLSLQQINDFRTRLEECAKLDVRGPKVLIRDIDTWLRALTDAGNQRPRTISQFASLLIEYLRDVPGHRIYQRLDNEGGAHVGYYVDEIQYHPAETYSQSRHPAYTSMDLIFIELEGRVESRVSFYAEDIQGMSASESLARKGYYIETPELRESYIAEKIKFEEIVPQIGKQYLAEGFGTDNLDGNGNSSWSYYHGSSKYPLYNAKVVMDVYFENEKEKDHHHDAYINQTFWAHHPKAKVITNKDDGDESFEDLSGDAPSKAIEIPIHPYAPVFDLRRHLRLRVHVNYLTEYIYDKEMDEKLVLPKVTKDLVSMLIEQSKVQFSDIIEGKGQGACILLGGQPGVGKTLTAEVFAESSERPLYSIQAAQLGIKANDVEQNLNKFLARGSRWKAIVLIDEADVYIRSRDTDMEHNAIVAAILRVMEYQSSILFMTTNLAKSTDDAIVSRCIARINYEMPNHTEQFMIWKIIAALNDIELDDETVIEIVSSHTHLAGRDIKQLLKLAVLQTTKEKKPITPEVIDFVAQFQPTIKEKGN